MLHVTLVYSFRSCKPGVINPEQMARSKFYGEQITNACGRDILQAQRSDSVPGDFTALIVDLRVTVVGRKYLLTEPPPVSSKRGVGLLTRLA